MGHYDTCRPGNCAACGQAKGVVWACGRKYCATYHAWLRQEGYTVKLAQIEEEIRVEREAAEEKRVTQRQIARNTARIAAEAKSVAEAE